MATLHAPHASGASRHAALLITALRAYTVLPGRKITLMRCRVPDPRPAPGAKIENTVLFLQTTKPLGRDPMHNLSMPATPTTNATTAVRIDVSATLPTTNPVIDALSTKLGGASNAWMTTLFARHLFPLLNRLRAKTVIWLLSAGDLDFRGSTITLVQLGRRPQPNRAMI